MFSRLFRFIRWNARFASTIIALGMVFAGISLWPIPRIASENRVDTLDILLRCVEYGSPRAYDAFRVLRANPAIARGIAEVPGTATGVKGVTAVRDGDGFQQTVHRATPSETFRTTTEHLVAPAREIAAAREGLEALYPPGDRVAWKQLREWGKGLFILNWDRRNDPKNLTPDKLVPPPTGPRMNTSGWSGR